MALLAMSYAGTALAQDAGGRAHRITGSQSRNVVTACTDDYPRFCPAPANGSASGRDQAICLKFYKNDLTLRCRRAVIAATAK